MNYAQIFSQVLILSGSRVLYHPCAAPVRVDGKHWAKLSADNFHGAMSLTYILKWDLGQLVPLNWSILGIADFMGKVD